MASKGPRSKLDHETRVRRQKALEAPKEPPRPKAHWDHVLEELVWLSKDFEAERKWKLAQAKKVAIRASKSIGDHATIGEKKVKEEEQRLRKVALNISKDVKKLWIKIEKLVLYKHQLELEERKKKSLDKQLDFLLGQTERYSTMLAENLVDMPSAVKPLELKIDRLTNSKGEDNESGPVERNKDPVSQLDGMEVDDDYGIHSEDEIDHFQRLLNVVCELSDDELLIQKHFMAIISSAWRGKWRLESNQSMPSSHNIYYPSSMSYYSHGKMAVRLSEDMDLTTVRHSSKLVLAALNDVSRKYQQEPSGVPSQLATQPFAQLDITLDFPTDGDFDPVFPSPITLSIPSPGPPPQPEDHRGQTLLAESSCRLAENRLRLASEAWIDGDGPGWASSAFPSCNTVRYRSGGKSQSLCKHKAVSDSIRSKRSKILKTGGSNDGSCLVTKFILPSPRPAMEFNDSPTILETDSDSYPLLLATDASLLEVPDAEYIPRDYDPNFFTGL